MPKNIPSLKPKEFIKILEKEGCVFYREGKGDHRLYTRDFEGELRGNLALAMKTLKIG